MLEKETNLQPVRNIRIRRIAVARVCRTQFSITEGETYANKTSRALVGSGYSSEQDLVLERLPEELIHFCGL